MISPAGFSKALFLLILWCLSASSISYAHSCKDVLPWIDDPNIVPECPATGVSLLPDTAPAMAIAISIEKVNKKNYEMVFDSILSIYSASHGKPPLILLAGLANVKDRFLSLLESKAREHHFSDADITALKKIIIATNGDPLIWQTDYFKSTIHNGMPVLRPIRQYVPNDEDPSSLFLGPADGPFPTHPFHPVESTHHLVSALSQLCPEVQFGPTIPPSGEPDIADFNSAYYGGNSLGLPGGICLYGDSQKWDASVKYFCDGKKEDSLGVSTKWLNVGHVDEIVNVVRDHTRQSPCDFAIALASPREAIRVMENSANRDHPFFDFNRNTQDPSLKGLYYSPQVKLVCEWSKTHEDAMQKRQAPPDPEEMNTSKAQKAAQLMHSLKNWMQKWTIPNAFANPGDRGSPSEPCPLSQLTNGKVAAALKDIAVRGGAFNELVQQQMDDTEKNILNKLRERTGCNNIQVIPLPMLFYGGEPVEFPPNKKVQMHHVEKNLGELTSDEKSELPSHQRYESLPDKMALSLLPNAANFVSIHNSLLVPKSHNQAFDQHIAQQFKQLGLDINPVETWNGAHEYRGNSHCVMNAMRICRPAKKGN